MRALAARVITREQAERIKKLAGASEQNEKRFLETFIQETQEQQRVSRLQAIASKRTMELIRARSNVTKLSCLARDEANRENPE